MIGGFAPRVGILRSFTRKNWCTVEETVKKRPVRARACICAEIHGVIVAAPVIMWAGAITSGGRGIGHGATVEGSESTAAAL